MPAATSASTISMDNGSFSKKKWFLSAWQASHRYLTQNNVQFWPPAREPCFCTRTWLLGRALMATRTHPVLHLTICICPIAQHAFQAINRAEGDVKLQAAPRGSDAFMLYRHVVVGRQILPQSAGIWQRVASTKKKSEKSGEKSEKSGKSEKINFFWKNQKNRKKNRKIRKSSEKIGKIRKKNRKKNPEKIVKSEKNRNSV